MTRLVALCLLALSTLATPGNAQTDPAAAPAAAVDVTPAFKALRTRFEALHRSLQNNRGISEVDRPTIERFRGEVETYRAAHPGDIGATAMALVLAQWVEDTDGVVELYGALSDLRPNDAALAMAWLDYRVREEKPDDETLFAAYSDLAGRFPDSPEIIEGWAAMLKERMAYTKIIELIQPLDPDPTEQPKLTFLLADALFASHRFEEASGLLAQIPSQVRDPRLRSDITRNGPVFEQYVSLWPLEQEIRAAEAGADDLPRVELVTSKGRILLELFENDAPNTVANFISLVESGFYDGTKFHRYVKDFMIQGGDPNSREESETTAGSGDPGYKIADEHTGENPRKHFSDSLAMANVGRPNTGGSQFYFNHRPTDWLNGRHTVFGRVVEGRDVVLTLREEDEILSMVVVRKRDHPYVPETIPSGT